MTRLLYLLPVLVCTAGIGRMMWLTKRGGYRAESPTGAPLDAGEPAELTGCWQRPAHRPRTGPGPEMPTAGGPREVAVRGDGKAASVRGFSELEAEVMEPDVGLRGLPHGARGAHRGTAERPLAYTTVMTVMDKLHRKGGITREPTGRAYAYTPTQQGWVTCGPDGRGARGRLGRYAAVEVVPYGCHTSSRGIS
jgi:hypothetical protein